MFSDKIYIVFVAFNLVLRLIYLNNDDTNDSIKKLKTGLVFRSLQKKWQWLYLSWNTLSMCLWQKHVQRLFSNYVIYIWKNQVATVFLQIFFMINCAVWHTEKCNKSSKNNVLQSSTHCNMWQIWSHIKWDFLCDYKVANDSLWVHTIQHIFL